LASWNVDASACADEASCQAKLADIMKGLDATQEGMKGKHQTIKVLSDIRGGVLSGKRVELPSAQRQHLERNTPLVNEITFDARHRPVSTNISRHFTKIRSIAPEQKVTFHTYMPLKKSTSSSKAAPSPLIVSLDAASKFSIHTSEGETLLDRFDLGHGAGRTVTQIALSPNDNNHFVASGDDQGVMRVHALKVFTKRESKVKKNTTGSDGEASPAEQEEASPEDDEPKKKGPTLIVTANFTVTFSLPPASMGEVRKLNSLLPVDRGSQTYFVAGDSLGSITVFNQNGTIKGRVRVSEDPGGVSGLLRSQGQSVLFYSSHSFGFFSVSQIDVQYPPCSGWNSPLFDIAVDPSLSYSRVVLALTDGDVLVFSTTRGKSKACDLTLKFPHVSPLPFKLHMLRGHVLALPVPFEEADQKAGHLRELFFFNLAAMEAGYGVSPSRAVALQVSFKPKMPEAFALLGGGSGGGNDRGGKSQIALRFVDTPGIEIYDVSLRQAPAGAKGGAAGGASSSGGGWGGDEAASDGNSWLNWFPKIGVFGVALIGVVLWNVRKATSQRKSGGGKMDDFDDEYFQERLRERRKKKAEKDAGGGDDDDVGAGGAGGLGDSGYGGSTGSSSASRASADGADE
jgi:hypothetical protein